MVQRALKIAWDCDSTLRLRKTGYYRLNCYSSEVYRHVAALKGDFDELLNKSHEFQCGFLRGMFDAEGSVALKRFHLRLSSKNSQLIRIIVRVLGEMGIESGKVHIDDRTGVFTISIYGKENLEKFANHIGFAHPEKRERISKLLRSPQNGVVSGESS